MDSYLVRVSSEAKAPGSLHNGDFGYQLPNPSLSKGSTVGVSLDMATIPNARPNIHEDTVIPFSTGSAMNDGANYTGVMYDVPYGIEESPGSEKYTEYTVSWTDTIGGADRIVQLNDLWTTILADIATNAPGSITAFNNTVIDLERAQTTLTSADGRRFLMPSNDPLMNDQLWYSGGAGLVFETTVTPWPDFITIPAGQYTTAQLNTALVNAFLTGPGWNVAFTTVSAFAARDQQC